MDLVDIKAVCQMIGGNRPVNPSTVYRYIAKGWFPRPIKVGGNSRWFADECRSLIKAMGEARHG
jgi:predicted DNA-binding transcriptional regulator AlpA